MNPVYILGNSQNTDIVLETRKRHRIPNVQLHELTPFEFGQIPDYSRKYKGAKPRTQPNPIYNCHGLTFASRRTGITDIKSLKTILDDDEYSEISPDDVLPGDIILYFGDEGVIEHSGIVVSEPVPPLRIPLIVSKWGKYSEMIHPAHVKPVVYGNIMRYYRVIK